MAGCESGAVNGAGVAVVDGAMRRLQKKYKISLMIR